MQLLDVVRLGGKAVGVHHGNLCAQVVAHLVELFALQVGSLQDICTSLEPFAKASAAGNLLKGAATALALAIIIVAFVS